MIAAATAIGDVRAVKVPARSARAADRTPPDAGIGALTGDGAFDTRVASEGPDRQTAEIRIRAPDEFSQHHGIRPRRYEPLQCTGTERVTEAR